MKIIKSNKAKTLAQVTIDLDNDHVDVLGMFDIALIRKALKKLPNDDMVYVDLINQMLAVTGVKSKETYVVAPMEFINDPEEI